MKRLQILIMIRYRVFYILYHPGTTSIIRLTEQFAHRVKWRDKLDWDHPCLLNPPKQGLPAKPCERLFLHEDPSFIILES